MGKKYTPQARYDAANTVAVKMKLNRKTDKDILGKLNSVPNKQGYIKQLIRADLIGEDKKGGNESTGRED